jgi:hypothetical protein
MESCSFSVSNVTIMGSIRQMRCVPVVAPWRSITIELLPSPSVVDDVFGVTLMVTSRELAEVKKNEMCLLFIRSCTGGRDLSNM